MSRTPVFSNIRDAVEGCFVHAKAKNPQLSMDRFSDRLGESKATAYKWLQNGSTPLNKLIAFENACGAHYVTRYLATAAGYLCVPFPTGRLPSPGDVNAVSEACADAVKALLQFAGGKIDSAETETALTQAMERLAAERAQVHTAYQPGLAL
ncbi:MAG: hypothetical protein ACRCV9_13100 [Burkholderiaceae bacterium]